MRLQNSCQVFLGLLLISQLNYGIDLVYGKDKVFDLQRKVEHLIEKIVTVIENYYHEIKTQFKCIPDEIPDKIVNILKSSIDCADENEKNRFNINNKNHRKNFLTCFSKAKNEIEETMASIDSTVEHCPENITEKTYQINVTTLYTKVFNINIKNGLEIIEKEIQMTGKEKLCGKNEGQDFGNDNKKHGSTFSSWEDDENDGNDSEEEYYNKKKTGDIYNIKDDSNAAYHKLVKSLTDEKGYNGEVGKFSGSKFRNLNEEADSSLIRKEGSDSIEKSKLSSVRTDLPEYFIDRLYDYGQ